MERCLSHMYYQWKKQGDNQDASWYTKGGDIQIFLIIPEMILDEYIKQCRGCENFLFPSCHSTPDIFITMNYS